jgi:phosphoribosylformylglycinamidine synthase
MEPFEILTSESQERMLAVVAPGDADRVMDVCHRWGLSVSRIGRLAAGEGLRVRHAGREVAVVPAASLADEGPVYHRPVERPTWLDRVREEDPAGFPLPGSAEDAFLAVLGSTNVASKRWVFEQYDQLVQGGTVVGPGADAAVIRLEGTLKGVAVSTDGNGRYGFLDPYLGAVHAVAEAARNVAAVGARPLAVTDCMNFGNPEHPEVMWSFAEAIRGLGDACRALNTPVTGGNVSFYNEAGDSRVYPTPVVGLVGLLDDYRLLMRPAFPTEGLSIYLLGETMPELGGSEFAEVVLGRVTGRPPSVDLGVESRLHELLYECARQDLLAACHDLSEGGLAVALAESSIAGGVGFTVSVPSSSGLPGHVALFSESASRAAVAPRAGRDQELEALAAVHGVPLVRLGFTGGQRLRFEGMFEVELSDAVVVYEAALPTLMSTKALVG